MGECKHGKGNDTGRGTRYILEHESPVVKYWKRLGFRRTTFADFEDTVEDEDLDIVPLKMGSRSKHVRELPTVAESIQSIVKITKSIGKKRKLTKKNEASIRIISPWLVSIALTANTAGSTKCGSTPCPR